MKPRNWKRIGLIGAAVVALLAAGSQLRSQLGIEFSVEGMQTWVGELGILGPLIYLALFATRQLLAIPAMLIIPVAGLCYGLVGGTLLATAGLVINAIGVFLGTRWSIRDGANPREPRPNGLVEKIDSAGPWILGPIVVHPAGPLTPAYVASGLSSMSLATFSAVTLPAALVRCSLWAFFGATLAEFGSPRSILATGILAAAVFLPIAYRAFRHGRTRSPEPVDPAVRTTERGAERC